LKPVIGVSSALSQETWALSGKGGPYVYAGEPYSRAVFLSGGLPMMLVPPGEGMPVEDLAGIILDKLDGLLLSGGGNASRFSASNMPGMDLQQPRRYVFEAHLIREAWRRSLPVLGICRGHQMMAEVLGGALREEVVSGHGGETGVGHPINPEGGNLFPSLGDSWPWQVNTYHCQVVEQVPPGFAVAARSPEGWIEAMEAIDKHFFLGVQFHPEMMFEESHKARRLFKAFMEAAALSSS